MGDTSATILVVAGTNGCGKSSVVGAAMEAHGVRFYNPDEYSHRARELNPTLTLKQANSAAWHQGVAQLQQAIDENNTYAFETTLGGNTIPAKLLDAAQQGHTIDMIYVGLASVELHIERVRERVARGGHDIPEDKIRERYQTSRKNLVNLLPYLASLTVYDNSEPADPRRNDQGPRTLLVMEGGKIIVMAAPQDVPAWAKPILAMALRVDPGTAVSVGAGRQPG